ncbi:hypothetical protein TB2_000349 [Malus domestica]
MAAVNTSDSDTDNHFGMKGISKGRYSFMQALIQGTVDGGCSLPASYSSFKLLKQTIDEVDQHCSLDILPILLEKAPLQARLRCPFHSSHATDVYSISMLATESNRLPCASVVGFLNFSEVSSSSKDLEKGYIQAPESKEEAVESLKREGLLARVFRRQASLKVGGKLLRLLFNHGTSRVLLPRLVPRKKKEAAWSPTMEKLSSRNRMLTTKNLCSGLASFVREEKQRKNQDIGSEIEWGTADSNGVGFKGLHAKLQI